MPSGSLPLKAPTTAVFSTIIVLSKAIEFGASFAPLIVKLRICASVEFVASLTLTENVSVTELLAARAFTAGKELSSVYE